MWAGGGQGRGRGRGRRGAPAVRCPGRGPTCRPWRSPPAPQLPARQRPPPSPVPQPPVPSPHPARCKDATDAKQCQEVFDMHKGEGILAVGGGGTGWGGGALLSVCWFFGGLRFAGSGSALTAGGAPPPHRAPRRSSTHSGWVQEEAPEGAHAAPFAVRRPFPHAAPPGMPLQTPPPCAAPRPPHPLGPRTSPTSPWCGQGTGPGPRLRVPKRASSARQRGRRHCNDAPCLPGPAPSARPLQAEMSADDVMKVVQVRGGLTSRALLARQQVGPSDRGPDWHA
jgi:hypothetical protein